MSERPLNSNCYIQLQILEANFLKDDGDAFGKQDPYIRFFHNGQMFRTRTQQDAGKHAKFIRVFKLENLEKPVNGNEQITFEAFDEDTTSDDLLAVAHPLSYDMLLKKSMEEQILKIDLYTTKDELAGDMSFKWTYFWQEPDVEPV